jgi:hypothetical protein
MERAERTVPATLPEEEEEEQRTVGPQSTPKKNEMELPQR